MSSCCWPAAPRSPERKRAHRRPGTDEGGHPVPDDRPRARAGSVLAVPLALVAGSVAALRVALAARALVLGDRHLGRLRLGLVLDDHVGVRLGGLHDGLLDLATEGLELLGAELL